MTIETRDGEVIRQLRAGRHGQGGVFRVGDGLAVLDPRWAQEVSSVNFAERMMPDRLVDVLRGRDSVAVSWKSLRAAWASRIAQLSEPPRVAELEDRLRALIEERIGRELDLPRAIQDVFTQALVPTVLSDLRPRELAAVLRDQSHKLTRLLRTDQRKETRWEELCSMVLQVRAGRAVRRVLRDRARGRRPRQLDLADPMVDDLPVLGMDRAAFAVTTVLTAIAGPPGAVATCLLLELVRRPDWAARVAEELAAVRRDRFHEAPGRTAPITYRFVKETLRVWTSPLVLTRIAQVPLCVDGERVDPGQRFHVSPYFLHHDAHEWPDPDTFDPDRWLPESGRGPAHSCAYAPFGWSATSCIGAGLGTIELMLLARLFTTEYRIDAIDPEGVEMLLASVPLPIGFRGAIARRADG